MEVRSGRFKAKGVKRKPHLIIKSKKGGAVYRIWNSGAAKFSVLADRIEYEIQPTHSLDICIDGEISITADDDATTVEGIYDYLNQSTIARSGRFKFRHDDATNPKEFRYNVIVLDNTVASEVFYRFFNSSETEAFSIKSEREADSEAVTLQPGLSIDVAANKNDKLQVFSTVKAAVDGIYEFLGTSL